MGPFYHTRLVTLNTEARRCDN